MPSSRTFAIFNAASADFLIISDMGTSLKTSCGSGDLKPFDRGYGCEPYTLVPSTEFLEGSFVPHNPALVDGQHPCFCSADHFADFDFLGLEAGFCRSA